MILAVCLAVSIVALGLYFYCNGFRASPDGMVYLKAADALPVPRPFHLRPLLPLLFRRSYAAWYAAGLCGLAAASVGIGAIALFVGLAPSRAICASALFIGLPIVRSIAERPIMVDGPALGLAVWSAYAAMTGHPVAAALIAIVGASVKEHVPIFAALAAWSPWPLVGLLVTVGLWLLVKPAAPEHQSQVAPFAYARERQADRLLSAGYALMPWGACLAALIAPTAPMVASLAVAYGLLFVASDSSRVFQWAAIPVCVAAAGAIPPQWLVPAMVGHFFVPRPPVI
jgi:hypothetical protein